ncbi:unnamed protein product [Rhizophagus irregularis]|nr:unnamed protein product [Rhizophagus irregularis]CAB4442685.1 unnamed protein product [Rhizophagus irregularis]
MFQFKRQIQNYSNDQADVSSWSCTIQKIFISKNADTADDEDQDEGEKEEKNLVVIAIIILMILSFT